MLDGTPAATTEHRQLHSHNRRQKLHQKQIAGLGAFNAQRTIRIGSIGPSRVVRMPVGKKAIWPAITSFRFDDDRKSSA